MRYIHAYKLAVTYKMTLMYFLVNIHINNQSTLYKVNGIALLRLRSFLKTDASPFLWLGKK
jgi:hypothetical protein